MDPKDLKIVRPPEGAYGPVRGRDVPEGWGSRSAIRPDTGATNEPWATQSRAPDALYWVRPWTPEVGNQARHGGHLVTILAIFEGWAWVLHDTCPYSTDISSLRPA